MGKRVVLVIMFMGFSGTIAARAIQPTNRFHSQMHRKRYQQQVYAVKHLKVKENLLRKYEGKMNGIQQLAQSTSDLQAIADVAVIRQAIDLAANQTPVVDSNKIETDIENALHSSLMGIFRQSIDVASKTYKHEASDSLFAIAPWNKKVVWNKEQTHVLMLTWIPVAHKKTYEDKLGNEMTIAWDAWVTAVPEVKEFTQRYVRINKNGFNLTDRIEQFLGLIPSKPPYAISQNKFFIEMWVRPEDLFRPCLDAEIGDKECMIDPHESDLEKLPAGYRDMSKLVPMTPEHKVWFDKEKKGKYEGQWAMPWTRFGYTYDWGSLNKGMGKRAAQGASEYLIKNGSKVIIQNIIATDEYPYVSTPVSSYVYKE